MVARAWAPGRADRRTYRGLVLPDQVAIGAVTGGAGTVLATKGREVEVAAGTVVNVLLQESMTVRVPVK